MEPTKAFPSLRTCSVKQFASLLETTGTIPWDRLEGSKSVSFKRVTVEDNDCDTSLIGEWTDDLEDGVIVRKFGEFYEHLDEDQLENLPSRGLRFRCFRPYAGGEEVGTNEYYQYGMQDYERMRGLDEGQWCFVTIHVSATVYDAGEEVGEFTSAGVGGIESDSDDAYLREVTVEQLRSILGDLDLTNATIRRGVRNSLRTLELEASDLSRIFAA